MRISDWSSDVCSSDLPAFRAQEQRAKLIVFEWLFPHTHICDNVQNDEYTRFPMSRLTIDMTDQQHQSLKALAALQGKTIKQYALERLFPTDARSEEHTSELQSIMRISYAVFCLKKKNNKQE